MKAKITLLAGLLLLIGGSKVKASNLIIDVKERQETTYYITVNNQTTYQTLEDISIKRLPAGNHHLYITKSVVSNRYSRGYGHYNRGPQVREYTVFDGTINIPPRSDVYAALRYQELFITDVVRKNNRNRGSWRGNPDYESGTCGTTDDYIYNDYIDPMVEAPVIYEMTPQQFNQLKRTIINESFESGKIEILRSVLSNQYVTSNQVLQLMNLFDFESYKLKLAKMAYANTIDKENYFTVNNGFTFSSSKRKLAKFIRNQMF